MSRSSVLAFLLTAAILAPGARLRALEPDSDSEAAVESVAATVIALEGQAEIDNGGRFVALELGQLLGPGDRVRTGEASGLHLVLADKSSLVLGPNTELTLKSLGSGARGSKTELSLLRGLLDAIVEKLADASSFEIHTDNAIAAVKGTDFEVSAGPDESIVTVDDGTVELGDPLRKRFEPVLPLHRRRLMQNRLLGAEALGKRDLNAFRQRWERAHMFHSQRLELLQHFRQEASQDHARFRRQLLIRRGLRRKRAERSEALPARAAARLKAARSGRRGGRAETGGKAVPTPRP